MRNPIPLIMLVLSLSSVAAAPKGKHAYWHKTPPGVIRISENYFYDETEVANVHWLEYLYWTKRIFGENSKEYNAALPDQKVWEREDSCLHIYRDVYLKPTAYYYYPLVGITQQQAEAFARWRSDRVKERTLILHHVIEEDTSQNRNKFFTIDKYFAGQYKGTKPDTAFMYYPDYRLPTAKEWQQMAAHLDSLRNKASRSGRQVLDVHPCDKANKNNPPTRPVEYIENAKNPDDIYGNVREWLAEKDQTAGGSWRDSAAQVRQNPIIETKGANAWTGFRCVCEWRRWDANRR